MVKRSAAGQPAGYNSANRGNLMSSRPIPANDDGAVRIRGHTLLCLQGFRGEGYSAGFIENMAALHQDLNENPDRWVEVVEAPDTFCAACPHLAPAGCSLN